MAPRNRSRAFHIRPPLARRGIRSHAVSLSREGACTMSCIASCLQCNRNRHVAFNLLYKNVSKDLSFIAHCPLIVHIVAICNTVHDLRAENALNNMIFFQSICSITL